MQQPIEDRKIREQLRLLFDSVAHPCLVEVKRRYYPARIPDLRGFAEGQAGIRT